MFIFYYLFYHQVFHSAHICVSAFVFFRKLLDLLFFTFLQFCAFFRVYFFLFFFFSFLLLFVLSRPPSFPWCSHFVLYLFSPYFYLATGIEVLKSRIIVDDRNLIRGIIKTNRSLSADMPIVPLVYRDWWEDFDRPVSRIWDQHFGRGLRRDDLITGFSDVGINRSYAPPTSLRSLLGNTNGSYYRPWRTVTQSTGGSSTLKIDKDDYQVKRKPDTRA